MGALIIIPAATAKRLTRDLTGMLMLAVALAIVATVSGILLAAWLQRESGPLIVMAAASGFLLSHVRGQP